MNYKNGTINYNKIPLHLTIYEIDAHAPSLIFIHGMSMHAGAYAFTIPNANFLAALSAEGFNVHWTRFAGPWSQRRYQRSVYIS